MRDDLANQSGDESQSMGTFGHVRAIVAAHAAVVGRFLAGGRVVAAGGNVTVEEAPLERHSDTRLAGSLSKFTALHLTVSDTEVTVIESEFPVALAIDAYPSPESARVAVEAAAALRSAMPHAMDRLVGVAFKGAEEPSNETIEVLEPACVYVAMTGLRTTALENARSFLDEVDGHIPDARAIAALERTPH